MRTCVHFYYVLRVIHRRAPPAKKRLETAVQGFNCKNKLICFYFPTKKKQK